MKKILLCVLILLMLIVIAAGCTANNNAGPTASAGISSGAKTSPSQYIRPASPNASPSILQSPLPTL